MKAKAVQIKNQRQLALLLASHYQVISMSPSHKQSHIGLSSVCDRHKSQYLRKANSWT